MGPRKRWSVCWQGQIAMPIFVSRFSAERVAGASLQRVRSRGEEGEDRLRTERTRQERRTERTREEEEDRQGRAAPVRTREALLVRNQRADLLLARLQERRNARAEADGGDEQAAPEAAQEDRATGRRGAAEDTRRVRTEVPQEDASRGGLRAISCRPGG